MSHSGPLYSRMKRRLSFKSRRHTFPSHEEPAKRQKWMRRRSESSSAQDWGNLPHHVVLQIFQHLSLIDRAKASSVCRCWNDVFHTPDLWRRFEFELNQSATSYLRSTHPDLIQQIIKKHAQHLQYVSFKVRSSNPLRYIYPHFHVAVSTKQTFLTNTLLCHDT